MAMAFLKDTSRSRFSILKLLSCPRCSQTLHEESVESRLTCASCRTTARQFGPRLVDFSGEDCPEAQAIFQWPSGLWQEIEPHLDDLRDGRPIRDGAATLQDAGLIDATGMVTRLGRSIAYHELEKQWQKRGDPLRDVVESVAASREDARVLDVGCGAGTTLSLLDRFRDAERVGLDCDLVPLALADRIHNDDVRNCTMFVRGDAIAMPFRDGAFSHVLSRVSLNYLPQPRALREMTRVLAPGGYLALRIEALGFDLHGIRKAPGKPRAKPGKPRPLPSPSRTIRKTCEACGGVRAACSP